MMNVSVKWQHDGEFRRFSFDADEKADAYRGLLAKVNELEHNFKGLLAWKDAEGDLIVMRSDAEVREAMRENGDLLRLHTVNNKETLQPVTKDRRDSEPPSSNSQQEFIGELKYVKYLTSIVINHSLQQQIHQIIPLALTIQATGSEALTEDRESELQIELDVKTEIFVLMLRHVCHAFQLERAVNIPYVTPTSGQVMIEHCLKFLDILVVPAVKPCIQCAIIELREQHADGLLFENGRTKPFPAVHFHW